MAKDFVLEIGTEEIPARFMSPAITQLEDLTNGWLKTSRIGFAKVAAYGTPRRLVVCIDDLAEQQEDFTEEIKGPSQKAAMDEEGHPTKAAEGFARSQGVRVEDLVVRETPNGAYVFAVKKTTGLSTAQILPDFCLKLLNGLSFPKPMRWGNKEMRFARPIRWILCLYGSEVVPFEVEGLASGRTTFGHRYLSKGALDIEKAGEYLPKLREAFVLVDHHARKELIWDQVTALAAREGGAVQPDPELLEEVTFLLEYPTPLCGTFARDYLDLPKEVLITPMREHQRYFPVVGSDGRLLAKFITLRNGSDAFLDIVREGNEKVLKARLADAKFFYEEDLKVPFRSNVEKLKKIVFLEGLGTVYDKVERIGLLAEYLAREIGAGEPEVLNNIQSAADLSKADLVTNMVYEFPELQGIMGREYALRSGENEAVAEAVFEHYLPRSAGDILPQTILGRLISIADKMDSIVGCFALGIQPTGSQDPFALRRQALGICHITLDAKLTYSLPDLVTQAYRQYEGKIAAKSDLAAAVREVVDFFKLRMKNIFADRGVGFDVVEAVLAAGCESLQDTLQRAEALTNLRNQEIFGKLLTAYTRVANLAKNAGDRQVNPDVLKEDVEVQLYADYAKAKEEMNLYVKEGQYRQFFQRFALLQPAIDSFFEGVMVMVEDEQVKNNRLALLRNIAELTQGVADLTKIVV